MHNNTTRLYVGRHVRHWTEQYDSTISDATATIVEVIKQHQIAGTWECRVRADTGVVREWNMVDVPARERQRPHRKPNYPAVMLRPLTPLR